MVHVMEVGNGDGLVLLWCCYGDATVLHMLLECMEFVAGVDLMKKKGLLKVKEGEGGVHERMDGWMDVHIGALLSWQVGRQKAQMQSWEGNRRCCTAEGS